MRTTKGELAGCLGVAAIFLVSFSAWLTHVIYCLTEDRWGFLIAGTLFAPVGVIHGILIWMGVV